MRAAIAPLVLLAACGDPLVGEHFAGTPQLSMGGVVLQGNARIPASHGELALSVFWIGTGSSAPWPIEQEARLDSGLAEYSMTLFDAPPPEAGGFSDLVAGGTLAIGVIALYADRDGDGALDLRRDLLLGAGAQHLLVYTGAGVSSADPAAALLGSIARGYHIYLHDRISTCRFVDAADCPAEGALQPAPDPRAVSLTLWPSADDVIVPAPALTRGGTSGSIWKN